jgi:hypothetical protein
MLGGQHDAAGVSGASRFHEFANPAVIVEIGAFGEMAMTDGRVRIARPRAASEGPTRAIIVWKAVEAFFAQPACMITFKHGLQ